MQVSVIIPAFNEERYLADAIAAIKSNVYPQEEYEIIVVSNGSTDRTAAIARNSANVLIETERRFVGAARNLGAQRAKGRYLAFLDADCLPATDWLVEGLRSLEDQRCITGYVCGLPDDPCWIEDAWFSQKRGGRREFAYINSGNLFVPRDIFMELGGFDETLSSGEDAEFCGRAKRMIQIIADDKIRVAHLGNPKTIKAFFFRELWHGMGALSSAKHNWFDKPLLGTLFFALFVITQLLELLLFFISKQNATHLIGLIGLGLVVFLTVVYRTINGAPLRYCGKLFLLYNIYYLGRMLALVMIILGNSKHQRGLRTD